MKGGTERIPKLRLSTLYEMYERAKTRNLKEENEKEKEQGQKKTEC